MANQIQTENAASFSLVKRLSEAMAYHVQEANKIAMELHHYAIPRHEHAMKKTNDSSGATDPSNTSHALGQEPKERP